jgi:hypothetical protein
MSPWAAVPPELSDYMVDSGERYGDRGSGAAYGWDSDRTRWTRDRNNSVSADERYDTGILSGSETATRWEIAVPNDTYSVRVVAGDPSYWDSHYSFLAEGATVVDATPSEAQRWHEGTVVVSITDGRLTVANGPGAANNKLCFVEISSTTDPTGVTQPTRPLSLQPGQRLTVVSSGVAAPPRGTRQMRVYSVAGRLLWNGGPADGAAPVVLGRGARLASPHAVTYE